jgi:hypothetical protein
MINFLCFVALGAIVYEMWGVQSDYKGDEINVPSPYQEPTEK